MIRPEIFSLGGITVELEGRGAACICTLFSHFFILSETVAQSGVRLQLHSETLSSEPGYTVYQAKALLVTRTENGFSLRCGASQLQIIPGSADAHCFLAPDFDRYSPFEQREFFLLGLLMLLRPFGHYGLHACGLERHGVGLLLVGSSGSGKTTTSLNLIAQGWRYLSDDAVLLSSREGNPVRVEAFRRGFSCTPETLKHFSELTSSAEFGDPDGKRIVYLDGSFTPTCTPSLIVFPRVSSGATHAQPLTSAQSLIRLCQQSAGIMTDTAVSQGQLEVLKVLVGQAQSFDLQLGRDALENPALADTLINQALEETLCVSSSN